MFKPGNNFTDHLFIVITFLPLLPAMLILFQKSFGKEPLNYLLIICLVDFIRDLPIHMYMVTNEDQHIINNVCYPIELTLLARLFRTTLTKPLRDILTVVLVAFLSSLLTWLSIKGWKNDLPGLEVLQNSVLIAVITISLPSLVRAKGLELFRCPLSWIAGGTLFYLLILLLLKGVTPWCPPDGEDRIFLSLAALIRYFMYTVAVLPGRDPVPAD